MPPLMLHNTLSGSLEEFRPQSAGKVKMYNCGPTVYDRQHLGNMFAAVLPDTLRRTLGAWGYGVKQVINITDFGHLSGGDIGDDDTEDKMSIGLRREGLAPTLKNMRALADKYATLYKEDIARLGVATNKISFPFASDYIPEQVALIKTLVQKGYAYTTSDGVYFDTTKFSGYGALGSVNTQQLQEGARVAANKEKHSPADFALWKLQVKNEDKKKKLGWDSPWGIGFPGWHIECTAMIFTLLGKQIDIHTGGIEHIPVHHNNEIAQAEAITGKPYVRYWLHNAHITLDGKKIAKSLGNTVYLSQVVDRGFSPRAFRYWVLGGHYRTPMNFTWGALEGANTALTRLTRTYLELPGGGTPQGEYLKSFYTAMGNDLNTAQALATLWELVKDDAVSLADKKATLAKMDSVLGLGFSEAREAKSLLVEEATSKSELPEHIQNLDKEREQARKDKDFAKADELRKAIEEGNYTVRDTPQGSVIGTKRN